MVSNTVNMIIVKDAKKKTKLSYNYIRFDKVLNTGFLELNLNMKSFLLFWLTFILILSFYLVYWQNKTYENYSIIIIILNRFLCIILI